MILTYVFVAGLILYSVLRIATYLLNWYSRKSIEKGVMQAGMKITGLLSEKLKSIREQALNQKQCDEKTVKELRDLGFLTKVTRKDSLRSKYSGAYWKMQSMYFPKKYLLIFSRECKLLGIEESRASGSDIPFGMIVTTK